MAGGILPNSHAPNVDLMISTIKLDFNDDSEACDSVYQIGHLLGSNRVMSELHRKSSIMWLYDKLKKVIERRLTVFCNWPSFGS